MTTGQVQELKEKHEKGNHRKKWFVVHLPCSFCDWPSPSSKNCYGRKVFKEVFLNEKTMKNESFSSDTKSIVSRLSGGLQGRIQL